MKRSVNYLHIRIFRYCFAVDALFENFFEIDIVKIFAERCYAHFCFFKRNGFDIVKNINARYRVGNDLCLFGRKLDTVRPIRLVTVVFSRVMRSRYIDARRTAESSYRKRHLGRRSRAVEKICFDTVCGKHGADLFGKLTAHIAAVTGNGDALFAGLFALVLYQPRKPLCRISDGVNVHSVKSRAENAAQTCRSETEH